MDRDIQILVIPDVHGRDFWKAPVKETLENTDAKIIFLGDYTDVYLEDFQEIYGYKLDEEGDYYSKDAPKIGALLEDTVEMLRTIIELKKNNSDRITLLLGNHDCGYAISPYISSCRRDKVRYKNICKLFNENRELFQLADEAYINDKHFIFSHAGINKEYAHYCFEDEVNEENVVKLFNEKYFEDNYGIMDTLGIYSRLRGRWGGKYGSLVWADALEWITDESNEAYGYSIVGHTRVSKPIINDKFAFIDNQQAFVINSNGEISTYKDFKNVVE